MSSLPLRIDGELIKKARRSGEIFHRSIPQQVEHWATLGQRLEAVISLPGIARMKGLKATEVEQALAQAAAPSGRERMLAFLDKKQGTSYGVKPEQPGILIRYPKARQRVRGHGKTAKSASVKSSKTTAKR